MKTKSLLALMFVILTLTACSPADSIEKVGMWEDKNGYKYEFEDGVLMVYNAHDRLETVGIYEFVDKDTMKIIYMDSSSPAITVDVKISGNTLYLTANGETLVLTRFLGVLIPQ